MGQDWNLLCCRRSRGSVRSPETAPRDVSAAYVDCEGCDPTGGIRVYTYRTAGTPPTPFWDQVGGTMTYVHNPADEISDVGNCIPQGDTCIEDPEDKCEKKSVYTVTGGGLMKRYSSGASGCQQWGGLTAAQKTLVAHTKKCDGAEQQAIFYGYGSVACAGPNLNDEKFVVWGHRAFKQRLGPPEPHSATIAEHR